MRPCLLRSQQATPYGIRLPNDLFFYFVAQHVKDRTAMAGIRLTNTITVGGKKRAPTKGPNVENNGFEPLTPCLQSRCSSQLS